MVQVSELLVERDGGIYRFSHLSFQEFLAATEIVRLKEEDLLYEHLSLSPWKDMILFYASLVNPIKLLQETISRNAIDLGYQISKQSDKNRNLSGAKKKELDEVKETIKALRYQKLEAYLEAKEWQKADFETVAKEFSQSVSASNGGSIGEISVSQLPSEVQKAFKKVKVGAIVGPIKTSNAYYIFKIHFDQISNYKESSHKQQF
jgi:parvulin-like peptidyl-prolyl isomerase